MFRPKKIGLVSKIGTDGVCSGLLLIAGFVLLGVLPFSWKPLCLVPWIPTMVWAVNVIRKER